MTGSIPNGNFRLECILGIFAKIGHGEVRVYRGTGVSRGVRRTTWDRSLKNWELQTPCFEEFSGERTLWDSSLPVSLPLWDTPALLTPPLPLPQKDPEKEGPERDGLQALLGGSRKAPPKKGALARAFSARFSEPSNLTR